MSASDRNHVDGAGDGVSRAADDAPQGMAASIAAGPDGAHFGLAEIESGFGYWAMSEGGAGVAMTPSACRLVGLPPSDALVDLQRLFDRFTPPERQALDAALSACLMRDEPLALTLETVPIDGERRQLKFHAELDVSADGRTRRVCGVLQDVTEGYEAALERQRGDQRLFSFLENLRDIVFCRGSSTVRVQKGLAGTAHVYGEDAYAIVGVPRGGIFDNEVWLRSLHPDDRDGYRSVLAKSYRAREPYTVQYRFGGADGMRYRWARETGWIVFDPDTAEPYHDRYILDVSDLVTTQQTARTAQMAAERALKAKSEFLAAMSHELRTPMNAIIGFSDIIERQLFGPVDNRRYRAYIHDIRASAQALLGLIDDLLDVSRIDAGRFVLHEEDIVLGDLVADAVRAVHSSAMDENIAIVSNVADCTVRADRRGLWQIIYNLLAYVDQSVSSSVPRSFEADLTEDGGIRLVVRDDTAAGDGQSGERFMQGDAEDGVDRSMRSFWVLDRASPMLGIPLVRRLLDLHGGTLTIRRGDGGVVTAVATLPPGRVVQPTAEAAD